MTFYVYFLLSPSFIFHLFLRFSLQLIDLGCCSKSKAVKRIGISDLWLCRLLYCHTENDGDQSHGEFKSLTWRAPSDVVQWSNWRPDYLTEHVTSFCAFEVCSTWPKLLTWFISWMTESWMNWITWIIDLPAYLALRQRLWLRRRSRVGDYAYDYYDYAYAYAHPLEYVYASSTLPVVQAFASRLHPELLLDLGNCWHNTEDAIVS